MTLYPYQEQVKELIQAGKSVILQAPTGAGKTRAALAPFIENFFDRADGSTPRKCVYAVPMRVLANQFEIEYRELAKKYQRVNRQEIKVTIQTGEHSEDKEFEGDLIFCTI
ncbi:MAG: DEAD/DEAH box helicase, partial [Chloroflexi bacterium]|nr:DEAD/DEAH box helicase [Chloroflexota bacterium]